MSDNDKIVAALLYTRNNIAVITDTIGFNNTDYWMDPRGVLYYGRGDSEDYAFLVHSLLLAGSVPSFRLRTYFGYKSGVEYSWLAYKRDLDEQWVILDAPASAVVDVDTLPLASAGSNYTDPWAYLTDTAYVVVHPSEVGSTYNQNVASNNLPSLICSVTARLVLTAEIVFPVFTMEAFGGGLASMSLGVMTVSATGLSSLIASGVVALPRLTIIATGKSGVLATLSQALPVLSLAAFGFEAVTTSAAATLPRLSCYSVGSSVLFDDDYILRFQ